MDNCIYTCTDLFYVFQPDSESKAEPFNNKCYVDI